METAVQTPASYSGRDPCLDQAGPSGCSKKVSSKRPLDNNANINNNNNSNNNNNGNNNNNNSNAINPNNTRNKRRGSFGNLHDKVKRRRRNDIVLPTKFMLGGSITDPLNLRSLENEEVNRLANQTPVASPAPAAGGSSERVEVIIPQNINDPLNLNGPELNRPLPPPPKKNRRRRNRNQRRRLQEESQNVDSIPSQNGAPRDRKGNATTSKNSDSNNDNNNNNNISTSSNNNSTVNHNHSTNTNSNINNSNNNNATSINNNNSNKKPSQNNRFRYGNYNRYYGYRNGCDNDNRLALLKKKWFADKSCLDIGCNVGHVTLSIARDHQPKQMIGLDIDPDLIRIAKKNIRHYVHQQDTGGRWFPASCPITFGPIAISGAPAGFPHNVFFISGNYVLDNDEMLATQKEEFDTIMCLSTTKWMQLNFGDDGLKRVFHRVYRQLRAGGRFILEPQPLSSYHKFITPDHRENFKRMQLRPDMYVDYIMNEVGFASYKVLGVGSHGAKGFQRPLYLFRKAKEATKESKSEEPALPGPSPAHECDTTTASI